MAYPLKFVNGCMYLSATVDPVPTMQIPSATITDVIDKLVPCVPLPLCCTRDSANHSHRVAFVTSQ